MLVSLSNMTEKDIANYGPLPDGHERHLRGVVGPNSCLRLEALPPSAGERMPMNTSLRLPPALGN